jgi:hypothetical protein
MLDNLSIQSDNNRNNNPLLPKSIRACIIGKSSCGKTNLLLNLLLNDFKDIPFLDYNHLYLFGKSLHQPEYQVLLTGLRNKIPRHIIKDLIKNKITDNKIIQKIGYGLENKNDNIIVESFSDQLKIPDPNELNKNHKNLIIFDDIMLEKQNKCETYYTRGRHNNVDCFYISQNYTKLPRHTIRENSNLFILFPQDSITLDNFHRDHCSDINKKDFKYLCQETWNEPYSFVTVDLTSNKLYGKYRRNLNDFYIVNDLKYR